MPIGQLSTRSAFLFSFSMHCAQIEHRSMNVSISLINIDRTTSIYMMYLIIIIYKATQRMDGFSLYMSNGTVDADDKSLCYRDTIEGLPNNIQNINCNTLTKNVYFFNNRSSFSQGQALIELCYIAIYGWYFQLCNFFLSVLMIILCISPNVINSIP